VEEFHSKKLPNTKKGKEYVPSPQNVAADWCNEATRAKATTVLMNVIVLWAELLRG
jgi:hypothetical protein